MPLSIIKLVRELIALRFVLMALPGAATQGWHADGGHLSPTEHLPCHCLNVFVPLVDVSLAEVGRSVVGRRRRGEG